jgi:DNA polymerase-3 subunit alpha
MDDTDKIKILVEDTLEVCKLILLPPDINHSDYRFMPVGQPGKKAGEIRYGLGAVKGSGQSAIEAITTAREAGPFTNLFDFCKRVDRRQINRRTIESLIRAGAFDCFGVDRAILLASVSMAMEAAEQAEAAANQISLFGSDDDDFHATPEYVSVPLWSDKQRLTEEKAALGFYLSGHLFHAYRDEVRRFARAKLSDLTPSREPRLIAGVISALRTQMTQRGKIVIVTLDDGSATVDVTVYSELYEPHRAILKEDEFLAVQGKVSEDRFSGGLRITAEKVMDIAAARVAFGRKFKFSLATGIEPARIKAMLEPFRSASGLPLVTQYTQHGIDCEICWPDDWRVLPVDALQRTLVERLGAKCASVEYG